MNISTLAQLIAHVESNNNSLAVRFEPEYSTAPHIIAAMKEIADCSYNTAKVLCAMSWGKYQIMGANLISLGLKDSPLQYVANDAMQDDFFHRYCAADHLTLTLADIQQSRDKRRLFCRLYNGPGNVDGYESRLIEVGRSLGVEFIA